VVGQEAWGNITNVVHKQINLLLDVVVFQPGVIADWLVLTASVPAHLRWPAVEMWEHLCEDSRWIASALSRLPDKLHLLVRHTLCLVLVVYTREE
jgi:hypothetical protein